MLGSSKGKAQPELDLPWIGCGRRAAKAGGWNGACADDVVGKLIIGAVEHVKSFCHRLDREMLRDTKFARQAQLQRGKVETASGVAPDSRGPVVDTGIVISIRAGLDIKWLC